MSACLYVSLSDCLSIYLSHTTSISPNPQTFSLASIFFPDLFLSLSLSSILILVSVFSVLVSVRESEARLKSNTLCPCVQFTLCPCVQFTFWPCVEFLWNTTRIGGRKRTPVVFREKTESLLVFRFLH